MSCARGLTLIEVLVAVALLATLLALGLPALEGLALDARRTAAVNGLVHGFHFARQESFRSLRDVVICRSTGAPACAGAGDWSSGWLVFLNRDGDEPPVRDADEPVLGIVPRAGQMRIGSNRRYWVLRPYPLRSTNGTFVLCDRRGTREARAVIVSYTGRPRVATRTAAGRPLACPP